MINFFIKNLKVKFVVQLKMYITDIIILNIIISKFSYKKEFVQIILFIINKQQKIGLYHITLSFSLAISLRVKNNE